eukprot:gene14180-15659_t
MDVVEEIRQPLTSPSSAATTCFVDALNLRVTKAAKITGLLSFHCFRQQAFESEYREKETRDEARKAEASNAEVLLQEEIRGKIEKLQQFEKENKDLKYNVQESEMRYEKLVEVGEEMKRELSEKIEELEDSLQSAKKEKKKLQQQTQKLQEELEEKSNTLQNKDETILSLKGTCKNLDAQMKTLMSERTSDLKVKEREKKLVGDMHAYQQKIDVLDQEKAVVERKLSMLHADFKNVTQNNNSLKKKLENSEKQLHEATDHYENRISKLQKDVSRANSEADKSAKDLAKTRKAADSLHDKITQLQVEVESQKHTAPDPSKLKAVDELEAKVRQLTRNINDMKTDKKNTDVKLRLSNKQISEMRIAKEQIEEELKEKERQYDSQELTIAMLKQTCTMFEGQVEELEVMNDEYQDREDQWNILKRQLYDSQEHLEEQLEEAVKALEIERSKRQKAFERYQSVEENVDDIRREYNRKIEQLDFTVKQQSDKIKELNESVSEAEKIKALSEISIKTAERKLEAEVDDKKKSQEEVTRLTDLVEQQKASNFALFQDLEAARDKIDETMVEKENLQNQIERTAYAHAEEKIKMDSTLAQQTKLIDFLNAKVIEDASKGKKGKFYPTMKSGKSQATKEGAQVPRRYREVEQALEKEKNTNLQLHLQLTNARTELQQVRTELMQMKSIARTSGLSAPGTPNTQHKELDMLQLLQKSPGSQTILAATPAKLSPSSSIADIYSKHSSVSSEASVKSQVSTERMHHNIPHKMQTTLNMRASKCPVCLNSAHFGKQISRCTDCGLVCHTKCASSLPNTCGLPDKLISHFSSSIKGGKTASAQDRPSAYVSEERADTVKLEGWLKIPRKGSAMKQGWESKWIVLEDMKINIYNTDDTDSPPSDALDLDVIDGEVNVHPAVPASELLGTASTDLPYALSVELVPYTTCWPNRTLYLLTPSFSDKQTWVSALECIASDIRKANKSHEQGNLGKLILHLEGKDAVDANCTARLNDDVMLLGAEDAMYGLPFKNGGRKQLIEIPGIGNVYQIHAIEEIGRIVAITGKDRSLCSMEIKELSTKWRHLSSSSRPQTVSTKNIEKIKNCHLFAVGKCDNDYYLCAAMSKKILILRHHGSSFSIKQEIETREPCNCIRFTRTHVLYGIDKFYCVDLKQMNTPRDFLDSSDTSLAFAVFGMTQVHTFPIAVFSIRNALHKDEFLLCYNEFGVFVDKDGRRTRPCDLKWNRLPLAFEYLQPFLYVAHFNSLEVCNVPLDMSIDVRTFSRKFVDIQSPRFLGYDTQASSLVITSTQGDNVDVISFRGNMVSGFTDIRLLDDGAACASGSDISRSTSNHSICSDEETSRIIGKQSPVPFRRKVHDAKSGEKKDNRLSSFRIPFPFKGSKRNSQFGD